MRKIHKILYSCFSFVLTLAYRSGAEAAYTCSCTNFTSNCSNTGSNFYTAAAYALAAMETNTACSQILTSVLCQAGYYVSNCYTTAAKTTPYAEDQWEDYCSYYKTTCTRCPGAGNGNVVGETSSSIQQFCGTASRSHTLYLCSKQYFNSTGAVVEGSSGQRKCTCTRTFDGSEYDNTIYRKGSCYIAKGRVVTEDSGATYDFTETCRYTD